MPQRCGGDSSKPRRFRAEVRPKSPHEPIGRRRLRREQRQLLQKQRSLQLAPRVAVLGIGIRTGAALAAGLYRGDERGESGEIFTPGVQIRTDGGHRGVDEAAARRARRARAGRVRALRRVHQREREGAGRVDVPPEPGPRVVRHDPCKRNTVEVSQIARAEIKMRKIKD